MTSKIPKIIHQLWIGTKPAPTKFMGTWKDKHPDFEYIAWSEKEIENRGLNLECSSKIKSIEEINGKADIIRWEILYKYGGVFVDADSICIEKFDDTLMMVPAFAGYENEKARPGLVATGTMGFPPQHPLCRAAIDYILANHVSQAATKQRAWQTVGPLLLTRLVNTGKYPELRIFPSHYFLPIHYSGLSYNGHEKVYAYQEWGSTKQNYDKMNSIELPTIFNEPAVQVSVLISSYNTNHKYILECLNSIIEQQGHVGIEIVWINDGSDKIHTELLERTLDNFSKRSRFCRIVYKCMAHNRGISACLREGILLCSNELIFKHDSDDIMLPHRIITQLEFMNTHPDCVVVGSNISMFRSKQDGEKQIVQTTNHREVLTLESYKNTKPYLHWIMNHPSLLYKKSAVLSIGNYNPEPSIYEDFEVQLKLLKRYGKIYNIKEPLVLYRLHPEQVTYNGKAGTPENIAKRNAFIQEVLMS